MDAKFIFSSDVVCSGPILCYPFSNPTWNTESSTVAPIWRGQIRGLFGLSNDGLDKCKRTLDLAVRFASCRSEFEPPRGGFVSRRRSNFICALKKNPLIYPTSKHRSKASPVSRELRYRCVWVGQRFEGFLDLRENVFFLSTMPGGPPRVEFFMD